MKNTINPLISSNKSSNFSNFSELSRLQSKLRDRDLSVERLKNEKYKLEEDLKCLSKQNHEFSDKDSSKNLGILEENRALHILNEDLRREIQKQKEMISHLQREAVNTPHFDNK